MAGSGRVLAPADAGGGAGILIAMVVTLASERGW